MHIFSSVDLLLVANGVDSELLFEDGAVARHMMMRSKRFKSGMIDDGDGWTDDQVNLGC